LKKIVFILISLIAIATGYYFFFQPKFQDPVADAVSLSGDGCVVLNYHRVRSPNIFLETLGKLTNNLELSVYSVNSDAFEKQIQYLKKHDVQFITPSDLKAYITKKTSFSKKCALVTFDDIDTSVYKHAYPILQKEKVPFTLFVITGEVGNPNFQYLKLASWKQLKNMKDSGLATIGTHTHKMHYIEGDEKPPFLKKKNVDAFIKDTEKSKQTMIEKLGFTPRYFAYPYGFGIPKTDEVLLNQGYELIFSLEPGIVKQGDPSFFIKRILIDKQSWPAIAKWAAQK
jgi:peptidoglycan/xylan/chitin deacetylase (PgdA/CDA1 family)